MDKIRSKIIYSAFVIFLSTAQIWAELSGPGLINLNPDPEGEPWIAGGIDKKIWLEAFSEAIEMPASKEGALYRRAALPSSINNSTNKAFRPVFNQAGGSCAQASGVGYIFTYEINCQRGFASDVLQNQYPYDYTYNFLNNGDGNTGTNSINGWNIIKATGIPNAQDYGGFGLSKHTRWVSGYEVYLRGMENRLKEYFYISIRKPEDIERMKQYLMDRENGSSEGGCFTFGADADGLQLVNLANGTPEEGKKVLVRFGSGGGHAMTIAGYNDQVRYDYNRDGKYTNDIDLNNDGKIDVRDWETGAALLINSWGSRWGNGGKVYIMYKVLADPDNAGGIYNNQLYSIKLYDDKIIKPRLTFKLSLTHTDRSKIRVRAGFSNSISATAPSVTKNFSNAFSYCGGKFPMQGATSAPIEVGLDISDLLDKATGTEAACFLQIESKGGTGKVLNLSMIDYSGEQPIEYYCTDTDVNIPTGIMYLKIIKPATSLKIVAPNGKELWERGNSYSIKWETSIKDSVKIELLKDGSLCSVIANSVSNTGSYQWNVPVDLEFGSGYQIRISSIVNSSKTDKSDLSFSIGENSIFNLTSPDGGEILETGKTINITWNDPVHNKVKLDIYRNGVFHQTIADNIISENGSYLWSIPSSIESGYDYTIRLTAKKMESRYDESKSSFTIINQPKQIPYVQSFDSFEDTLMDSWKQISINNGLMWTATSNLSAMTENIGPGSDHTSGVGKYLRIKSFPVNATGDSVVLQSPIFSTRSKQDKILSFWVHMSAPDGSNCKLSVDINANSKWVNDVFLITDDHPDKWFIQTLNLASYNADFIQVRFRTKVGANFSGEICLDDFRIGSDITFTSGTKQKPSALILCKHNAIYFKNQEGEAKILSLNGCVISTFDNISNGSLVDISFLKSGTYLLIVKSKTVKFIKTGR